MTEDDARQWTADKFGEVATDRLARFVRLVIEENARQNLISPATIPDIWTRHVVDSLQLISLAGEGRWLDIGTGGGFPGLAIALVRPEPMILVEPRRKRAEFLDRCINLFALQHARISPTKVEAVSDCVEVISARAVASIGNLLRAAAHCVTPNTRWLLPRGSVDRSELGIVAKQYGMVFHVEQSVTHAESSIVVMRAR